MKISVNEPSFGFFKTDIFNFPVCKIYLGTWARMARRARGYVGYVEHVGHVRDVGHVGHVGTLGTPFSRLVSVVQGIFKVDEGTWLVTCEKFRKEYASFHIEFG